MKEFLTIKDIKNTAQEITDYFLSSNDLLVCNGQIYEKRKRFFSPIGSEEKLIRRIYQSINREQISQISTRAIKEAAGRIMNHPALQFDFEEQRKLNVMKLNLLNGVYDIQKRSFSKEQDDLHFDYVLNFNYMYNVRIDLAKVFVRFVESSLGREYLLCLLRILAYLISSLILGRKAFLLLGKGSTGKSTLLELIEAVVGVENTSHVPFHMMGNIHARAEYQDKRLNISRDNSDAPMRNEDAFKNLVSCEMTSGRRLYENLVDFIPRLKFIFASNVDLHFAHPDDAVYDRLLVIPFTKEIPEKDRDRELLQKLLDEKDIIFSVAIDQLSDLVQSGFDFKEPDASIQIINWYREALHTAESYLRECCDVCGGGEVSSVELYRQYRSWCSENGMEPDGRNAFYSHVRAFSDSISEGKVAHGGKRVNGFRGIRPKYTGDAQESDKLTE